MVDIREKEREGNLESHLKYKRNITHLLLYSYKSYHIIQDDKLGQNVIFSTYIYRNDVSRVFSAPNTFPLIRCHSSYRAYFSFGVSNPSVCRDLAWSLF